MTTPYVLPVNTLVLVTGANGFIASHTVDQLLKKGFKVRGTVRAPKPWLNAFFDEKYGEGRFETVTVKNIGDVQELENAMQGVGGVIHMATDLTFSSDPHAVIPWVTDAVRKVLEAASRTKTAQRVVLTSSSRAAYMSSRGSTKGVRVDGSSWNEASIEAAWDPMTPEDAKPFAVYSASKTECEKAAWAWMRDNQPHFEFNTVLPDFNTGRILHPEIAGSTMGYVRTLLKGDPSVFDRLPPRKIPFSLSLSSLLSLCGNSLICRSPAEWYVDVEDTARLHVIALLSHDVKSRRLFAFAASKNWTDYVQTLRKLRPNKDLIPEPPANERHDEADIVLAHQSETLLKDFFGRQGWTPLDESLAAGIEGLD
ncbi:unnamed protein product [Penicillium egyptiacum]|uniref:NAD-dependent epimerase/dehydratase domain-containing protein n=1 Tax=Penicillium egyptiacum TaxID=1303716 RepID=A0A9W4KA21_9EURO|nr:unnamed protein product [Penicillium egyptiacum]